MESRTHIFDIPFRPPYRWNELIAFLAPRAMPGIETVEGAVYRRSISLSGSSGWIEVSFDRAKRALIARVNFPDAAALPAIAGRIGTMFDVNADWRSIARILRADPRMKPRVDAAPGLRVPGCWDGFEMAVRAIIGQQVSVKAATTIAGRVAREFGISPDALQDADLTRVGLTRARAATIRDLARAVREGDLRFTAIDVDEFRARICEIRGIGNWTAQYIAMRALNHRDAFPSGDLGLLHALGIRSAKELDRRAEAWRPWRSYATMYLWSILSD